MCRIHEAVFIFLRAVVLFLLLPVWTVRAESSVFESMHHSFRVVVVADGLADPWGMTFLPDGDILVTERPGRLRILRDGRLLAQPVSGVPAVRDVGQGGLLDVLPHPQFQQNRMIYLSYASSHDGGVTTHVARGRLLQGTLQDVEVIFRAEPSSSKGVHFGSRLVFDRENFLYITVGDRGQMQRAQDLEDHAGKILRLHDDGRVPNDNPFIGQRGPRLEIFSFGHRNPQGLTVHPETGEIWEHEHGPRGGDEINLILPGRNYGWPIVTLGIDYTGFTIGDGLTHADGMEDPLHHWTPSIAPSGMAFYAGKKFPKWEGDLFIGALAHRHLARVRFSGTRVVEEERLLEDLNRRVRDVRVGPEGNLWVLTDHDPGQILRLEPID